MIKHLDTIFLCAQQRVDAYNIAIHKKPTKEMLADLLTKFLTAAEIVNFVNKMGFTYEVGGHSLKLKA